MCGDLLSSYFCTVSRILRRGLINLLDSVSGLGAWDWYPFGQFLPAICPVGVGTGSPVLLPNFVFLFWMWSSVSFVINFIPLFCTALESSCPFYTGLCDRTYRPWQTQLETLRSATLSHNRGSSSDANRRRYRRLIKPWTVYLNNSPLFLNGSTSFRSIHLWTPPLRHLIWKRQLRRADQNPAWIRRLLILVNPHHVVHFVTVLPDFLVTAFLFSHRWIQDSVCYNAPGR